MKIKQMTERLNSVPVRKKAKRLLAITLAVLMVNPVTGYAVTAHAQEMGTITAFGNLSSEIATQQLAVGAEESDINLPDTLSVTLSVYGVDTAENVVEDSQTEEIPTEEVKPDESNLEEPAADESPADDSSVSGNDAEEPQEDGNSAEDNTATDSQATVVLDSGDVPLAATTTGSAISADLDDADDEQTETEKITSEERTLTGITWQINAVRSGSDTFDSANAGAVFFYEPVLPEGYTLADGVSLPQIQVQIEESVRWVFSQSTTIDGVEITVKAEKDVFPEGAVLHAEKVTNAEDKEKIQSAISEEVQSVDTAKNVTKLVSFDITITDAEGNELQPDTCKGEVKVFFAQLPMVTEDTAPTQELKIFHMDDSLNNAQGLDTTVNQEAGTLEAPAEHFTVYTAALLTATAEDGKASVTDSEGAVTYYDTIEEAFAAAQGMSGSTLKLLANVSAGDLSVSSNPMVLDLNSFTLTCGKIDVGNAFTLIDTGSGGKVLGNNVNGAIWLNNAQITISGGRIEATGAYASALRIFSGSAIIEGGSFHSQNGYGVMQQAGSVSISDGEFSTGSPAARTGFSTNGGTAQISGGRFINGMGVSGRTLNDIISSGHALKKQDDSYILDLSQSTIKDDVSVVEASIAITGQPTGAELLEGYEAGAHTLTVPATAKPGVTISYTWYRNDTEISDANEATYALPAGLSAGAYVYYCKLSESGGYYVLSNKVTVKVYSSAVEITQQPTADQSTVVTGYTNPPTLTIGARLPAGLSGEFSYQWYQKSTTGAEDAKVGENQSSYQLPIGLPQGSYTYYCKLSYAASVVTSDPVTISVADAVASMQKAGETDITYFTDLQDAFSSAPNNGSATIRLLKDCTRDSDLVVYQNRVIIFDLGGHTLTFSNNNGEGIKNYGYESGQLTLENGNLVGNGFSVILWGGKSLTVRNTTIKNQNVDVHALIFNAGESLGYSGRSLWLEEGTVLEAQNKSVTGGNVGVLNIMNGGDVHINGGTIRNTGSGVVVYASVSQNIHLSKAGVIQGGNGQVVGNVYFDEDDTDVTVYGGMEYHLLNEMVEDGKATVAYADSSKTAMYNKSYGESGATVSVTISPSAGNAIGGLPEISYDGSQTVSDVTKASTEGYGIADQALTFTFTMPKGTPVFRVPVKQPNAISAVEGKNSKVYDGNGFNVSTIKGEFATWNGNGVATVEGYYTKNQAGDYIQTTVNGSGATMTGGTPVNAGSYYVKLAVGEGSEHLSAVTYLPITITQAELEITGLAATNRPYDGTNTVALTGGTLSGICGTDDVTAAVPTIGTVTDGNVGNDKAVTVAKPSLSGTAAGNYKLADISNITVNITPAVPVLSWPQAAQTVTYTSSAVSVTSPVVTLVNNETFSGNITYSYKTADATSDTDGLPTDAGTYLVKAHIKAAGNYVAADSQDMTLTIEKATPTITINTMDGKIYDGTAIASPPNGNMTITGAAYGDVKFVYSKNSDMGSSLSAPPQNAGSYYVQARISETNNTHAVQSAAVGFTITKASAPAVADPDKFSMMIGLEKGYEFDLTTLTMPTDAGTKTYSVAEPSDTSLFKLVPTINGNTLRFTSANAAAAGKTATALVTILSDNYADVTVTFNFEIIDKAPVVISGVRVASKAYDGAVAAYTGTPMAKAGGSTVAVSGYDYKWSKVDGTPLTEAPKNAGDYKLMVSVKADDPKYMGSADVTFTISKATATIKADDKNILIGATKPSYTATATGLVNGDTISGITFTDNAVNTNTKGSFTITPVGGTISGGNDNYNITYETGTLTINIDVSSIDTAIAAANTAKNGISVDDRAASQVSSGTKFVTTAEMSALISSISTATASKSTVSTIEEAKAAAMALNDAVTIFKAAIKTGTYIAPSGGGSSGGGTSSGGSTTTTPAPVATPEKMPNQPVTAMAPVIATAVTNGAASASIPDKAITDAIAKAQADAKAQGKTANGISVELDVTMPKGTASLTATLTRNSLDSLVSAGVSSLEINGSLVQVSFDKKALTEIQKQSSGNISIAIAPKTNLSDAAKKLIGTRPVYDITVGYGNGKSVSSFGGGVATVSIPYTLGKNEAVGGLYAVYVDAKGNANRIAGSAYDINSGCVIFTTTHFSQYGIGYTAPTAKFTDISTHWAKESVDYVVGRGLLSGTSDTAFSPNSDMTRGMLVTALGRLAGVDTKAYTGNSFTDVNADSAYRPYIEWAYSKGIIQGIGGGQFAPDRAITREEIAAIFANYAKATGYTLPITREATTYADASSIGSAYKDAVKAMQQAGIMMGGSDNKFNPKGNATRAEVSSMLNRYIKLTINPDTAQGWTLNDAGQYLYYKDGKALTGTQTIDGVKYFFNTDGTLKTGWVKDGDNWRFYSGKTMLVGFWDLGANGNNKTYYFTKDGLMVSGKWLEIDGKWYYFNTDGSLARSTKIDGYEVDEKGVRKAK
ncbi:S-layer homology domain-containing protein [Lacrimispora brassicae]